MSKPLLITDYVDENLKLVRDEDGTDTALELSKDKLKINGDLAATGYTDNIKLRSEAIVKTDGNVTLDSGGDLTLDSHSGNFIAKKAGTEFSAANSAYAGMILGYTALAIDIGDASYTTTTSMAVPHSSLQVTFVAPPSGKVEISVSIFVDTVAGRNLVFGLSDNSTYSPIDFPNADDVTNEHYVYKGDETDEEDVTHQWVVEGLTAGTSYTWYFGAKAVITAGAYVLKWGGNITGEYAPFIMKATALPATIYTG